MKRYTQASKKTKPLNIFEYHRKLKNKIQTLKDEIFAGENTLQSQDKSSHNYIITDLKADLYDKKTYLEELNKQYDTFKRNILKVGAVLGATLIISSAVYASNKSQENFNNIGESYTILYQDDTSGIQNNPDDYIIQDNSDLKFKQFEYDVARYLELTNKDHLNGTEKKELKNIKERIKANPEKITEFALKTLKQRLSSSLGIDDYNRLEIHDYSTERRADAYNPENCYVKNVVITLDGDVIASYESSQNLANGHITIISNSIPEEVLKVSDKIVNAQRNSHSLRDANSALAASLALNSNELSFNRDMPKEFGER